MMPSSARVWTVSLRAGTQARSDSLATRAKEAIGQHISLIIPVDRRDEETTILERLRRGERIDHFDTVRVRKDGTTLDISLTISPVRDSRRQDRRCFENRA